MRRCALAVILFLPCVVLPCVAFAQVCNPVLAGGTQLESARFLVGFRTEPQAISVGRYFTVEFAVCPKPGVAVPDSVAVDAHMPEHRHGMNYKTQVTAASIGHYLAAGLMFHMPGRWEFIFDVRSGDKTDHLVRSVVIQ